MGERGRQRGSAARGPAPGFWAAHHNGELTGLVVLLALVLVTAVLGGFRDATPAVVDRGAGQTVDLGAWQVTAGEARLQAGRSEHVTVTLRMTNTTKDTRPVGEMRNAFVEGSGAALTARPADPTIASLDPDVPVDLLVEVLLPDARSATLTLLLRRDPPVADPLTGQRGDQPGTAVARVALVVEPAA